jgi:peroxiredoxin Q/BCP
MTSSNIFIPTIGQPMPPFELPLVLPQVLAPEQTTTKAVASTCNAQSLKGRAHILFVYPRDATCGCTLEANGFRDLYAEFRKLNMEILGLSRDTIGAHRKFIDAQNLPFGLLSDKEQNVLKAWNLIVPGTMYGKPVTKVARTTFLIDENLIVRQIWRDVVPEGHATQVLQEVEQSL